MHMVNTITLDPEIVNRFENVESQVKNASDLQTYAAKINLVANAVEDNWTKLPKSVRQALTVYVYHMMDRRPTFTERLRSLAFMWRVWTSREELSGFLSAIVRLENVVLDQIE